MAMEGLRAGDLIFEVGSGPGKFTEHAIAAVPGIRIIASDPSEKCLAVLRLRPCLLSARVQSVRAFAEDLSPVADAARGRPFKAGVLATSYQYVDPAAATKAFARLLAPGGKIRGIWDMVDFAEPRSDFMERLRKATVIPELETAIWDQPQRNGAPDRGHFGPPFENFVAHSEAYVASLTRGEIARYFHTLSYYLEATPEQMQRIDENLSELPPGPLPVRQRWTVWRAELPG
jgi:ubiquinone/menaquinone biosynthesis C-methylase UbiE